MDNQNTYKAHTTIITDKSLAMELADWGFAIAWEFKRPEKIKEGGGSLFWYRSKILVMTFCNHHLEWAVCEYDTSLLLSNCSLWFYVLLLIKLYDFSV